MTNLVSSSINHCHSICNSTHFEVIDPEISKCYINLNNLTEGNFNVLNTNSKDINFLAIDKCIFHDTDDFQKCDFGLFTSSEFTFVEIKSPNGLKGRFNLRQKAYKQLESTIQQFQLNNFLNSFVNLKLEAIVCFICKKSYPARTSSSFDRVKYFIDNYNVRLNEGNQKEYI